MLLHAARAEGTGPERLPDFLGLEHGDEFALLGQDEIDISVLEASLREQLERDTGESAVSWRETERILLYGQLGLALTYHPDAGRVDVQARPLSAMYVKRCPRGESPLTYMPAVT